MSRLAPDAWPAFSPHQPQTLLGNTHPVPSACAEDDMGMLSYHEDVILTRKGSWYCHYPHFPSEGTKLRQGRRITSLDGHAT